jgi:hypothetical protein
MKKLLLEIWGMSFYTDNTVCIKNVGPLTWILKDETLYISNGCERWPIDITMSDSNIGAFYADLFYAIAEQELLS